VDVVTLLAGGARMVGAVGMAIKAIKAMVGGARGSVAASWSVTPACGVASRIDRRPGRDRVPAGGAGAGEGRPRRPGRRRGRSQLNVGTYILAKNRGGLQRFAV
jgi:hypothetical protein